MGGRPTTAQERRYIDLKNGPTSEQYQRCTLGVTLVTVETKLWRGGFIEILSSILQLWKPAVCEISLGLDPAVHFPFSCQASTSSFPAALFAFADIAKFIMASKVVPAAALLS